uniref:Phosphatidate cytidylyltransferase n=1 Tax=Erythrolobus australicus TaxID=1077150 RepID=A0A7S1XJJ7_9RHOD
MAEVEKASAAVRRRADGANGANSAGDDAVRAKREKKKADHATRMLYTWLMVAVLLTVLYCGHVAICVFVFLCGAAIFNEVLGLGTPPRDAAGTTGVHLHMINWGFFLTAAYLTYGKSVLAHFSEQGVRVAQLRAVQLLMRHHSFVAFCLYTAFFLAFVLTLRPGAYRLQFGAFARAHITGLLVLLATSMTVLNIKNGLVWFLLPATLVIINDSFAYLVGRRFGKTPLVALSPNKTVEGFLGGAFATLVVASAAAFLLSRPSLPLPMLYCPKRSFSDCAALLCRVQCARPPLFTPARLSIPPGHELVQRVSDTLSLPTLKLAPIQLHALALALFASVIAPFGGFFASGLKRAFGVKDFADLIPGHGGVTDRMDCQLLMAVFTYVYSINFVAAHAPDVEMLSALAMELARSEQLELLGELAAALAARGVDVSAVVAGAIGDALANAR